MKTQHLRHLLIGLFLFNLGITAQAEQEEEFDPAEVVIGERLFMETRFAYSQSLKERRPDPVMSTTQTTGKPLPGPYPNEGIGCRACHLVDEHRETQGGGMRSYTDFARLSPQPERATSPESTRPRNAQSLVNTTFARDAAMLFHHDGQFTTLEDLVKTTLTGREYGWLPTEKSRAIAHIAQVIREDDGRGEAIEEFGGSYRVALKGVDAALPKQLRLPESYRLDVDRSDDTEILEAVARLVAAYVTSLSFSQDKNGEFNGSPYDAFLEKNHLPRKPNKQETTAAYSKRLLQKAEALREPTFVRGESMGSHPQTFTFAEAELQGMKLFFSPDKGNCVSCHNAPLFTNFGFHNTGISELNYNQVHGKGAFRKLKIPSLKERNSQHGKYLPATSQHPEGEGRFRTTVNKDRPGYVDLGLWNIYANPDFPAPQPAIHTFLCESARKEKASSCTKQLLVEKSVARFKTPALRDLGHSQPYMHNGVFDTLEQVLAFYLSASELARNNDLVNADPELKKIHLSAKDISALAAFLRSLNEDYE